mgnify:CR=1 FL=1
MKITSENFSSPLTFRKFQHFYLTKRKIIKGGKLVNKDFEYCLVELEINSAKANYVIAKELIGQTTERLGVSSYITKGICTGKDLEGLVAKHPYLERGSIILTGDHVTTEAGTGIVHTAPGHGLEDYSVARENGLEVLSPVKSNGTFKDEVEHVSGMFVFKSNETIIGETLTYTTIKA